MKKVIALLLVSALVSVATFAQDAAPAAAPEFKFSGGVETGIYYSTASIGVDAGTIRLYDFDDTGVVGVRAYVAALFDAGSYGLKVKLRTDYVSGIPGSVAPYLAEGYAWVSPLDGQLTFKVGAVTESALSTGGNYGFLLFDSTYFPGQAFYGASLVIAPKGTGLTIGAFLPLDITATPSVDAFYGTTVAVKFALDKIFDVVVGYGFADSSKKGIYGANTPYAPAGFSGFGLQAVSYGFNLLAVPGFTLNAEGYIPINAGVNLVLDEKIGIAIDKLSISVLSYQFIRNGDVTGIFFKNPANTADFYATIRPYATIDLGGVIPGIYVFINTANSASWAINPEVKFAFGTGTFLFGASIGTNHSKDKSDTEYTDVGASVYTGFQFLF